MTNSAFRQHLKTQYQQLGPLEKIMVQFLALYYTPVSRVNLLSSLKALGCRDESQKPWDLATLRPTLERLLAQKLVVDERGKGLTCAQSLRELVCRETIQTGKFEALVAIIHKVCPIKVYSHNNRRNFQSVGEFLREVRIGIYRHDLSFINRQ